MNERGHNTLVQAGLMGHTQIFGALHDDHGDCAMGVFHLAIHAGRREAAQRCFKSFSSIEIDTFGDCCSYMRFLYSISMSEEAQIVRLNDEEHLDFIGIARKLYRPTEEGV